MYTAIFGGTFNPFHIGHYSMLKGLQENDIIDKILIMPDKIPPHKVCDYMADASVRIEMCKIAAEDFPKAQVSLLEFERDGKSYTYDTIIELKKKYPSEKFIFVCGGDMLVSLNRWYRYSELIEMVAFIAFRRGDVDNTLFDERVSALRADGAEIIVSESETPQVSSSEIREDFKGAKDLMPSKIYKYLEERGAYIE